MGAIYFSYIILNIELIAQDERCIFRMRSTALKLHALKSWKNIHINPNHLTMIDKTGSNLISYIVTPISVRFISLKNRILGMGCFKEGFRIS